MRCRAGGGSTLRSTLVLLGVLHLVDGSNVPLARSEHFWIMSRTSSSTSDPLVTRRAVLCTSVSTGAARAKQLRARVASRPERRACFVSDLIGSRECIDQPSPTAAARPRIERCVPVVGPVVWSHTHECPARLTTSCDQRTCAAPLPAARAGPRGGVPSATREPRPRTCRTRDRAGRPPVRPLAARGSRDRPGPCPAALASPAIVYDA